MKYNYYKDKPVERILPIHVLKNNKKGEFFV